MKTAELKLCPLCRSTAVSDLDNHLLNEHMTSQSRITQILLDGMKEGMRRAATEVLQHGIGIEEIFSTAGDFKIYKYRGDMPKAILSAAEQMTEKALSKYTRP